MAGRGAVRLGEPHSGVLVSPHPSLCSSHLIEGAGCYWALLFLMELVCNHKSQTCLSLIRTNKLETNHSVLLLFVAEPTFLSRVCSSAPLFNFMCICPFILFILLLISLLCFSWKARKLSTLSRNVQKDKALWLDMKGPRHILTDRSEEEDDH